jgi:hypothetical protein
MAAAAVLCELARNTKVTFDANNAITQLSTLFSSGAVKGAIVLNMDNTKSTTNFQYE